MEYQKKIIFPKKESDFVKQFMNELKKRKPEIWYFKTHGEPMQTRGIPDVLMSYGGICVGIEFKIMRAGKITMTPYQEYIRDEMLKSGCVHFVIFWNTENGNVGIGSKVFDSTKESVECLIRLMDILVNVPACEIKKIFNSNLTSG